MVVILNKYVFLAFTGLLNLRGSDIELNPVFYSYVIVSNDEVRYDALYTNHEISIRANLVYKYIRICGIYLNAKKIVENG